MLLYFIHFNGIFSDTQVGMPSILQCRGMFINENTKP